MISCTAISFSQGIDCKYLSTIIYLKVNPEINEEIRRFFRLKKQRKGSSVNLSISDKVAFWDIAPFKEEITDTLEKYGLTQEILKNESLYEQKYGFETITQVNLSKILPKSEGPLKVYFSKPVGNTLIVEITNIEYKSNLPLRFGKGFRILFFFSEEGLIEGVRTSTAIYN